MVWVGPKFRGRDGGIRAGQKSQLVRFVSCGLPLDFSLRAALAWAILSLATQTLVQDCLVYSGIEKSIWRHRNPGHQRLLAAQTLGINAGIKESSSVKELSKVQRASDGTDSHGSPPRPRPFQLHVTIHREPADN